MDQQVQSAIRTITIAILACIAFVFIIGTPADDDPYLKGFVFAKIVGLAFAYSAYKSHKHWRINGETNNDKQYH